MSSDLRAVILAADGVEQVEVEAPSRALARAGASVRVLSPDGKAVRGYHYIEPTDPIAVQGSIADENPDEIDLLVVPGGLGGPDTLRKEESALQLVARHVEAGKPLGVICHGPWVLIDADVLKGRTLTCVPQLRSDVTNAGAHYVDEAVHVDETAAPPIVSGRNFKAAEEFANTLVRKFAS